jgi:hypothetical protein
MYSFKAWFKARRLLESGYSFKNSRFQGMQKLTTRWLNISEKTWVYQIKLLVSEHVGVVCFFSRFSFSVFVEHTTIAKLE